MNRNLFGEAPRLCDIGNISSEYSVVVVPEPVDVFGVHTRGLQHTCVVFVGNEIPRRGGFQGFGASYAGACPHARRNSGSASFSVRIYLRRKGPLVVRIDGVEYSVFITPMHICTIFVDGLI